MQISPNKVQTKQGEKNFNPSAITNFPANNKNKPLFLRPFQKDIIRQFMNQRPRKSDSFSKRNFPAVPSFVYLMRFLIFPSIAFCLMAGLFFSCSQEKKTWTSLAWHNTLARYNGYFIAKEKMKEYEEDQLLNFKDNYNRVLDIYPFPPLGSGSSANGPMEEIIKKASIPIQRHKNSKWVDDCYQLVGQARFYKEDWENAVQTFKFINTKFTDIDAKHKAVIWLLITYTRMGDYSNAKSVIAYLKKEKLSKENLREGALAFSYYYLRRKEYQKVTDYLSMAMELMPRSKRKGRLLHALGQLHQKFGHDDEAFAAYRQVLRCQPNFELEFFSRLNMAQTVAITEEKQLKKIRKNFVRMTTDLKYEDYLDKVYYQMGCFEVKQNNLPKGIDYLKISLKKGKGGSQKAYTYLKLAELHYKPLRSYVWAKNYYDSCMQSLDTLEDNYKAIAKRQKVLAEFVKHYETVQREDSLQKLARMDSTALFAIIDKKIKEDREKKAKADKEAKKLADQMDSGGGGDSGFNPAFENMAGGQGGRPAGGQITGQGGWYFGNIAAVAAGRLDFKKKWGNRKLEDNWRRSSKEAEISEDQAASDSAGVRTDRSGESRKPDKETADSDKEKGKKEGREAVLSQAQLRAPYLKDLPSNEAALKASHEKLQVALFEMGKIYDQKLEEPEEAILALERDVKDYPRFEKVPEALYNLCLIYRKLNRNADFERCKSRLLKDHPESIFAKLIVNPNYLLENKQRNEIIGGMYRTVFEQYKAGQYIEASNGIAAIRQQFPKSDFEDKLAILQALITAKTVDIPTYISLLKKFLTDYPNSNLKEFAQECLKNAEKGKAGPAPGADVSLSEPPSDKPAEVQFNAELNKTQYFLAIIPTLNIPEAELKAAFSDFNSKYYPGDGLSVTTLPLGDNQHVMIKVQELPTKVRGMYYLKKVMEAGPFKKDFKNLKPTFVLVTQENLQKLYKTKAVKEYAVFYAKNYDLQKELDDEIPAFGK
jgi:outer membrane protein assembly factor BamD (BamD/ComL family)